MTYWFESSTAEPVESLPAQLTPFALQFGAGALTGFAVGFTFRKLALFALFLTGASILLLFALTQVGIATVNWSALDGQLQAWLRTAQHWAGHGIGSLSLAGAGFTGGVILGLRMR